MPDRGEDGGTLAIGPDQGSAAAVAIIVHGRGRSAEEMRELAQALDQPTMRFLMPSAPGATWYPEGFMAPLARNEPALTASLGRLGGMVDALIADGIPAKLIVLGGFSQGACLVAEFVIRHPRHYGAVFILTGGFIGPTGTEWRAQPALSGTPVYISGSKVDTRVPVERVLETERILRASGAAVTARIFADREHLVVAEEIAAVRTMLSAFVHPSRLSERRSPS